MLLKKTSIRLFHFGRSPRVELISLSKEHIQKSFVSRFAIAMQRSVTAHSRNLSSTTTTSTMTMTWHKCERANTIDTIFCFTFLETRTNVAYGQRVIAWMCSFVLVACDTRWRRRRRQTSSTHLTTIYFATTTFNYITSNCQCLKSVVTVLTIISSEHHTQRARKIAAKKSWHAIRAVAKTQARWKRFTCRTLVRWWYWVWVAATALRSRVFAMRNSLFVRKGNRVVSAQMLCAMTSSALFIVERRNIKTQGADVIFFFFMISALCLVSPPFRIITAWNTCAFAVYCVKHIDMRFHARRRPQAPLVCAKQ